ncbi:MAG: preprotein translocase subunit SecG [Spirochaetia bacterium]|nr:preprotein translocase subunit SecG [Spirochaetia bacterium]
MGVLSIILLVLFVIVSLLLIFLVAVQDEQSEGLGGIFGGGSNTAFGSHTSSVVTKATGMLAVLFLVLALVVAFINKTPSQDALLDSVTTEQVQQTTNWWVSNEAAGTEPSSAN